MEQVRVVIFADILGFKSLLKRKSLIEIAEIVRELADNCNQTLNSGRFYHGQSDNVSFDLGHAQFSDAVLLWSPDLSDLTKEQRSRIRKLMTISASNFLGKSFERNISLRLGMAEGSVIIDPDTNVYVGQPIVDAYELESSQQWIGGAIHHSVCKSDVLAGFHKNAVEYSVPLKEDAKISSDVALNWPYYTKVCDRTHVEIENWLTEMSANVLSVPHGEERNDNFNDEIIEKYENTEKFLKWALENANPQKI